MAKAAVLEEDTIEVEATPKQVINDGITRFIEATGIDGQKARYKAQRAIAFQAFLEAIEDGDYDRLVEDAIANSGDLPSGWGLERAVAQDEAAPAPKKTAAKPAAKRAPAKKAAAKAPAKTAARRRPARKSAE